MKKLVIVTLAASAALVPAIALAQPAPPPPPPPMHHPGMTHHGPVRVHTAPPVVTHHAPPAVVVPHDMDGDYYDEGYDDYYDGADGYEGDYPPPPPPAHSYPGYGYGYGYGGYAHGGMVTVTETTVKTYGCCAEVHHAPVKHYKKKYRSKSHYAPRKRVRPLPGERG